MLQTKAKRDNTQQTVRLRCEARGICKYPAKFGFTQTREFILRSSTDFTGISLPVNPNVKVIDLQRLTSCNLKPRRVKYVFLTLFSVFLKLIF